LSDVGFVDHGAAARDHGEAFFRVSCGAGYAGGASSVGGDVDLDVGFGAGGVPGRFSQVALRRPLRCLLFPAADSSRAAEPEHLNTQLGRLGDLADVAGAVRPVFADGGAQQGSAGEERPWTRSGAWPGRCPLAPTGRFVSI
jgi:hypothetical protein